MPEFGWTAGTRLPGTPEWTMSVTADYETTLAGAWTANIGGGLRLVDDRIAGIATADFTPPVIASYTSVDLHAGVANDNLEIGVYVRNAFDNRAYISDALTGDVLGINPPFIQSVVLQPRTIGVSLDWAF